MLGFANSTHLRTKLTGFEPFFAYNYIQFRCLVGRLNRAIIPLLKQFYKLHVALMSSQVRYCMEDGNCNAIALGYPRKNLLRE